MANYVVGLTGGIGSGKTAASDYFARQGIDVVDADIVAREVVAPGEAALIAIQQHFGDSVITERGELDRAALRQIVFTDNQQKTWLNELLHPLIRQRILEQLAAASSPYVLLVAPLLLENNLDKYCQRVLVIDVPESVQTARTVQRDGANAQQVQAIIDAQIDRQERLARAHDVVDNQGSLSQLYQQLARLDQHYRQLASH